MQSMTSRTLRAKRTLRFATSHPAGQADAEGRPFAIRLAAIGDVDDDFGLKRSGGTCRRSARRGTSISFRGS